MISTDGLLDIRRQLLVTISTDGLNAENTAPRDVHYRHSDPHYYISTDYHVV